MLQVKQKKQSFSAAREIHNTGKILSGHNNAKSGYPWKKVAVYPRLKAIAVWPLTQMCCFPMPSLVFHYLLVTPEE